MKKSLIINSVLFMACATLFACRKNSVDVPQFDVSTTATTYKVGQTVTFNFTGNAKNIAFWSGETGHIYANRNRTSAQGTVQAFTFTSLAGAGTQTNNLSVQISKDFNGTYDAANVQKATWTNLTATLSAQPATGAAGTSTASGSINITSFGSADNKPVYIAFHYLSPADALIPRPWTISTFGVTNTLADGTVNTVVASLANAGFKGVDIQNATYQWAFAPNSLNPTTMSISAGPAGTAINEDWAISAPILLNSIAASDYGVSVSSLGTLTPPVNYTYAFAKAGTYVVTFYAFNQNVNDVKSVVKELTITVTP